MDHYYSSKPSSESKRETMEVEISGHKFSFITDAGVFSKNRIDVGSEVLMTTAGKTSFPEGDLLDVGCGYGPIGLYLAAAYPGRQIEMVDVNERALELAKENAKLNETENVKIYQSDLFENVENRKFAGIISNPPIRAGKKVVHQILEEAYDYLAPGGLLQIVIQKNKGHLLLVKKWKKFLGM